ncbi:serine hydrolase domain-containing protein [Thalassotalea euphylliae]|uniref:serine hydrolase domain-containing protein n=1 Tax=Thalassotalea euphylliae TaxID=1655234 RepID=UPI003630B115
MKILNKLTKVAFVFVPAVLWIPAALLLSFEGLWMTPVAAQNDHKAFMTYSKQVMSDNLIGNGVLVLIEEGKVVERHYQSAASDDADKVQAVNGDTLFPAASMSKLIAALSIHTLTQQQKIALEESVDTYITSWRLPPSNFNHEQVTIARLLSHTAGLTDGLGFGDYTVEESLPSLVETLNNPRSSSGEKRLEVGIQPGSEFKYSGGSYLLLELLVEEVTGESYESWVTRNILKPRGLTRSHFNVIESSENSTPVYDSHGQQLPPFQYASSAATAMNTSANDLVALFQSIIAEPQLVEALSTTMATAMGAPIWGLGAMLYAPLADDRFVIGHDGSNDPAINTSIRINPVSGDAYIALVSGHKTLASEIGFEWVLWQSGKPDFIFFDRAINSSVLPIVVGSLGWIILLVVYFRVTKRASR